MTLTKSVQCHVNKINKYVTTYDTYTINVDVFRKLLIWVVCIILCTLAIVKIIFLWFIL